MGRGLFQLHDNEGLCQLDYQHVPIFKCWKMRVLTVRSLKSVHSIDACHSEIWSIFVLVCSWISLNWKVVKFCGRIVDVVMCWARAQAQPKKITAQQICWLHSHVFERDVDHGNGPLLTQWQTKIMLGICPSLTDELMLSPGLLGVGSGDLGWKFCKN